MDQEDTITRLLHKVLDERDSIDHESHKAHHLFIEQLIDDHRIKRERWEKVRQSALGWVVMVGLTGVGTAVWAYVVSLVNAAKNHHP